MHNNIWTLKRCCPLHTLSQFFFFSSIETGECTTSTSFCNFCVWVCVCECCAQHHHTYNTYTFQSFHRSIFQLSSRALKHILPSIGYIHSKRKIEREIVRVYFLSIDLPNEMRIKFHIFGFIIIALQLYCKVCFSCTGEKEEERKKKHGEIERVIEKKKNLNTFPFTWCFLMNFLLLFFQSLPTNISYQMYLQCSVGCESC